MTRGIVLRGPDRALQTKAETLRLGVVVVDGIPTSLPFDHTLLVAPRTPVPWAALDKAMQFLERWDAVVPLWRYGVLARDLGTAAERRMTEALTLDLRIPVYACELLFVQRSEAGMALVQVWGEEIAGAVGISSRNDGDTERLAFLRAVARVKPRLCVLPTSWLGAGGERRAKDERVPLRQTMGRRTFVRVEVESGRYVQCRAGEEERVKAQFARRPERSGR